MEAHRKNWIKIGEGHQRKNLQDAAQNIDRKWPDRFDFRITPETPASPPMTEPFRLFLKHR